MRDDYRCEYRIKHDNRFILYSSRYLQRSVSVTFFLLCRLFFHAIHFMRSSKFEHSSEIFGLNDFVTTLLPSKL